MLVETQNLPEELEDLDLVFPLEIYHMENTTVQVMQVLLEERLKPNLTPILIIKTPDWLRFIKSQDFLSFTYLETWDCGMSESGVGT